MVFIAWATWYGVIKRYEIIVVKAVRSGNLGKFLFFDIGTAMSSAFQRVSHTFSIDLFVPNHAPIMPLPGAFIKSNFRLVSQATRESIRLISEGYGSVTKTYYTVGSGPCDYGIEILNENVRLMNHDCTGLSFVPSFISSLV